MRLGGDVDALAAVDALLAPRGRPRSRCRAASSATSAADDAESAIVPPPPPATVNSPAEPDRAREAVEQGLLHLGPGGGGRPEHPLAAQAAREEVAEQRGERRVRREVAEERRVLPVQGRGDDDAVERAEQRLERLRVLREQVRQPRANLHRG